MNFFQAVSAAITPTGGGGGIVTSGLVFHIDPTDPASYPGSGNTIYDLAGTNNGTFEGGVYVDANGHLRLDGVNDAVRIGTIAPGHVMDVAVGSWTIEGWAYNNGSGENFQMMYSAEDATRVNRIVVIRGTSTDQMFLSIRINNNQYVTNTPIGSSPDFTWQHVSGTYDHAANIVAFYINGSFVVDAPVTETIVSISRELRIGARGISLSANEWNGRLGYVAQYNRVLTPSEILQNFNATKASYGL